jgi:hypothetical protein
VQSPRTVKKFLISLILLHGVIGSDEYQNLPESSLC